MSLLPSVETETAGMQEHLTTFDCELSANADIMELVLVQVALFWKYLPEKWTGMI